MAWRVAKSLLVLRDQINALAPNRNKAADGTIGDAAHSATASDHNPNKSGVVCAIDITHDPANGVDAGKIARLLAASRDPRIKYIISNGEICNSTQSPWVWRKYTGANKHNHHFHLSVNGRYDETQPWTLDGALSAPAPEAKPAERRRTLMYGYDGDDVKVLQRMLGLIADGDFGPKTRDAVKVFQKSKGLVADGVVGPYTWEALK